MRAKHVLYGIGLLVAFLVPLLVLKKPSGITGVIDKPPSSTAERQASDNGRHAVPSSFVQKIDEAPIEIEEGKVVSSPTPTFEIDQKVLRGALAIGDDEKRLARLTEVVRPLVLQDVSRAIAFAETLQDTYKRGQLLYAIAYEWGGIDLKATVAWVETLPNQNWAELAYIGLIRKWVEIDPQAAAEWSDNRPKPYGQPLVDHAIAYWARRAPREAAAWIDRLPNPDKRGRLFSQVARVWAESDLWSALSFAQGLSSKEDREQALSALLYRVAAADSQRGVALLDEISDPFTKRRAGEAVARGWTRQNPQAAIQWAEGLPEGELRSDILKEIAYTWALTDPRSATELMAQQKDHPGKISDLWGILRQWTSRNPQEAALWVQNWPHEKDRTYLISAVAGAWADPKAALAWVERLLPEEERLKSMREIADSWARQDPQGVSDWVMSLPEGKTRNDIIHKVVTTLSTSTKDDHVDKALILVGLLPEGQERDQAIGMVALKLAEKDPPKAVELIEKIPTRHGRIYILSNIAERWAKNDIPSATRWALSLPEQKERIAVLRHVTSVWGRSEPQAVLTWAVQLPEGEEKGAALRGIADGWGSIAPREAMNWVEQLPDGSQKSQVIDAVMSHWVHQSQTVSAWLSKLLPGPTRDQAIRSYALRRLARNPQDAIQWTERIEDGAVRQNTTITVAQTWLRLDRQAAEQWIRQSSLPEGMKTDLLKQGG
jgi:hypothetical protein